MIRRHPRKSAVPAFVRKIDGSQTVGGKNAEEVPFAFQFKKLIL
jgi:hypothetical protein